MLFLSGKSSTFKLYLQTAMLQMQQNSSQPKRTVNTLTKFPVIRHGKFVNNILLLRQNTYTGKYMHPTWKRNPNHSSVNQLPK